MKPIFMALGALAALATTLPAQAKAALDCPLCDAPFSIDSPLVDILLSLPPGRWSTMHPVGRLGKIPAQLAGTQPPTFAAILSLRRAA